MAELASELTALAGRVDPAVIAVGGDQRALKLLHEALPDRVRHRCQPIEVTRASDGSIDELDAEVDRVLRAHADHEMAKTREIYRREIGQHDRATAGPVSTLSALRAARVTAAP